MSKMTRIDINLPIFLESLASMAIEDNQWAIHMLELWRRGLIETFLQELLNGKEQYANHNTDRDTVNQVD